MSKLQTLAILLFLLVTISASQLKNSLRDRTSTEGCSAGKVKVDCTNNGVIVGKRHCCELIPWRSCHATLQDDGSWDYNCTWHI